jgi:hypothetical protein
MDFPTELRTTLVAAMDRLIPADEYPSASNNGVLDYLERQFDGDLAGVWPIYRAGLESLNLEATAVLGRGFAELGPAQQDELLRRVETGAVSTPWPTDPAAFFTRLVDNVAEGYYADPEHNFGNPGKLSWKMIGFVERKG